MFTAMMNYTAISVQDFSLLLLYHEIMLKNLESPNTLDIIINKSTNMTIFFLL